MNEFIISTKGSLWESSCPEHKGERQGSRKGSRKGKRIIHYGIGDYDVSDIDRYIAEGNVKKGNVNGDKHQIITYLMNEKGYSENDAWLTYDAWATHDNMVYGIPPHMYEKYINKYREMVGLPPLEDSHKGSRKGSRKGLRYNWDGVPFEEIEYRLDSPVIDEDIYSMSDEELLQFAEDHGLRPEMFTNELPDWAQRDGSRKGSRRGNKFDLPRYDLEELITKLYGEQFAYDYLEDGLIDADDIVAKYPNISKIDAKELEDAAYSYEGGRKGSSEDVWERFMGYENASDPQIFNKFCQVFLSVTGHPFESDYGEEFDNENLAQQIVNKLDNELPGSRKGSRKGEAGDTDQSQLFIYLYEQDTTDNNTLRNMWNSLSSDEQDYILFQFGESRQDFEESFN